MSWLALPNRLQKCYYVFGVCSSEGLKRPFALQEASPGEQGQLLRLETTEFPEGLPAPPAAAPAPRMWGGGHSGASSPSELNAAPERPQATPKPWTADHRMLNSKSLLQEATKFWSGCCKAVKLENMLIFKMRLKRKNFYWKKLGNSHLIHFLCDNIYLKFQLWCKNIIQEKKPSLEAIQNAFLRSLKFKYLLSTIHLLKYWRAKHIVIKNK